MQNNFHFIEYREKGKTIYGEYYIALLQYSSKEIKEKRPHLAKKKVLFHQDNALAHTSVIVMSKFHDLHYQLLRHRLCSSDLAASDYC